ncbi:MAG: electron transfer flavoprotein subunit alpha/FixB family protein, partial [Bacteroidia bacterium]|nr:electron transfer flavoprotein subunit alpha/FixB family protein [Bacteroidia bacterium]
MSVLVYTESEQGKFKKSAFEAASYARAVADQMETSVTAVAVNQDDVSELGNYGVDKVLKIASSEAFNAKQYAHYIKQAAETESADIIVLSSTADSRYLAPILAVGLNATYASNVIEAPSSVSPFTVKR